MRDIRNDIQERLDALAEELFRLEARLGRLQQLEEGFRNILAEEETHWPQQESLLSANGRQLAEGFGNILAEEETDLTQQEPFLSGNGRQLAEGFGDILAEEETDLPQQEPLPSANGQHAADQQLKEGFGNILAGEETDLPQEEPRPIANGQPKEHGRAVQSYSALGKFIFATLNDGNVWSLDDLTKGGIKAGVLKGKSDPRKVMQMVLEGMKQNGKVEMPAIRMWSLPQDGMESS
jgi:hypothetical protein